MAERTEKTYTIPKFKHDYGMDPKTLPVLKVDGPSAVIRLETDDSAYLRSSQGETADEIGWHKFNAVTGPVFVNGAAPGVCNATYTCSSTEG